MKAVWLKLSARIDAMTLRERIAIFVAAVAAVVFVVNALALEPLFERNRALANQIRQQNEKVEGIDIEIAARMAAFEGNPDKPTQERLAVLKAQAATLAGSLQTMQSGLVTPEKMTQLLQQMLRSNSRLKLLSLRTLPVAGLGAAQQVDAAAVQALPSAASAAPVATAAPKQRDLLYRHGVELTLQGSYLDMLDYMEQMEGLPTQLFWGRAQLDARKYPETTLTLTLYTVSLDEKWMKL